MTDPTKAEKIQADSDRTKHWPTYTSPKAHQVPVDDGTRPFIVEFTTGKVLSAKEFIAKYPRQKA